MSVCEIVEKLFPFSYSIVSQGSDDALGAYLDLLPFTVHEYSSGAHLNGWQIPDKWSVEEALIIKDGKIIYDGSLSALGVGVLSPSFEGKVSLDELKKHVAVSETLEDAIVYHWTNLYRPNDLDWFFCMPRKTLDSLENGEYEVRLITKSEPGTMKVLEYTLQGETDERVILNGHNCHPFQANDDLSGVAVAIEIMKRLKNLPKQRLTYTVLIAPELHGPMFWLQEMTDKAYENFKAAILFKSVGNKAALRLQRSYEGDTWLDKAAYKAFSNRYETFEDGAFRSIYGNDETVFDTPPYNIPTISLTRWPFVEYHTDQDTPDRLSENDLSDTVEIGLEICQTLERNITFERRFEGLVCLSAYGLYKSVPPVQEDGVDYGSIMGRWNRLMNCLPNEIEKGKSVLELSEDFELPEKEVYDYLMQWVEHGLIKVKGT